MSVNSGLHSFVDVRRTNRPRQATDSRAVYLANLERKLNAPSLHVYVADRGPLFYRDYRKVADTLEAGLFLSALKETLSRLPTSSSFRESHFGEIVAGIFAEEVLGLRRLYSKLSLLTAENANAYKMDLVMYDPQTEPVEFTFCEVKSSCKHANDGLPPRHDTSCYADIFNSLNKYGDSDLDFDLTAARDHVDRIAEPERAKVRAALLPYGARIVKYLAFAIIDTTTLDQSEVAILGSRKNKKTFDVEVVSLADMKATAENVYELLNRIRQQCST